MSSDANFHFFPSSAFYPYTFSVFTFPCFILFVAVYAFWLAPGGLAWALSRRSKMAIPGPSGFPILGSAFLLADSVAHRVLAQMAARFGGGLMAFSVGFTRMVISDNPDTAKEILNSSAFADRPVKESAYGLLFDRAMGFAPYGVYWRNLRRIAATHLFSPKRVASLGSFRREIGEKMVEEIKVKMECNSNIEPRKLLHFGSLNNVMMTVFGISKDFSDENGDGYELEILVTEGYELLGIFNWSDHFPVIRWFDFQGVRKRSKKLVARVNSYVGKIIDEHRVKRAVTKEQNLLSDDEQPHDFVDVLLDLEKENMLSDSDMIAVLWEMIFRGTDTVAILLEWILARMILHPDIQSKAQDEIDRIIGSNRSINDTDLVNLPYIQAIVKESLRVHPPGPLLSWARLAVHDTHIGPHFIPAGTTAMVNMWAITHDSRIWPEPEKFRPERFIDQDVSIMGSDLRLAPFGSGRRVCPGKSMGLATVQLWLAQLLQRFKWTQIDECGVDLSECLKLSMEMKKPLVCQAIPRFP